MDNEVNEKFINENIEQVEKILEILHRDMKALGRQEKDNIRTWREVYNFEWPVIMEATKRAQTLSGNKAVFRYADGILKVWSGKGVKSVDDILALDKKMAEEAKKRETYKAQRQARPQSITMAHDPHYSRRGLVELKPCPFCGSADIVVKNQFSSKHNAYYTLVECVFCGANTRTSMHLTDADPNSEEFWKSDSVKEVAMLWNTRA